MKLWAILVAFKIQFRIFLHTDSNNQILDKTDILKDKVFCIKTLLEIFFFSTQSSVSLFFIKDYLRFLQLFINEFLVIRRYI